MTLCYDRAVRVEVPGGPIKGGQVYHLGFLTDLEDARLYLLPPQKASKQG